MNLVKMRQDIVTNVVSLLLGTIIVGASTLVWRAAESNGERIGYVLSKMITLEKKLQNLEKELHDVEAIIINHDHSE